MQELVYTGCVWKPTNKQKLPAVVSATPAVVQMERALGVLQQHMRTASSIAKLRSRCVYLESAPVEIEIYIIIIYI